MGRKGLILIAIVFSLSALPAHAQAMTLEQRFGHWKTEIVQKVKHDWHSFQNWWHGSGQARIPASTSSTQSTWSTQSSPSTQVAPPSAPTSAAPEAQAAPSQGTSSVSPTPQSTTQTSQSTSPASTGSTTPQTSIKPLAPPVNAAPTSLVQRLKAKSKEVKTKAAFRIVKPGRKASRHLKKDRAGVAEIYVSPHIRSVPRLDIGVEPTISAYDYELNNIALNSLILSKPARLPSPAVISVDPKLLLQAKKIASQKSATQAKGIAKTRAIQNLIMTPQRVRDMKFNVKNEEKFTAKKIAKLSQAGLNMLSAQILLQNGGECKLALGILFSLRHDRQFGDEAYYHIAKCAKKLNLPNLELSATLHLLRYESSDYTPKVISDMPAKWSYQAETKIGQALRRMHTQSLIPTADRIKVNYLMALSAIRSGDYAVAKSLLVAIPRDYSKYLQAQYLLSVAQYALGDYSASIKTQQKLVKYFQTHSVNPSLQALVYLNLGAVAYQAKKFEVAKKDFIRIDKNSPLWIQGLTEEGWAQLQIGDFPGAIGNMYSVQSPFFKEVYVPETYVIRTIGYINLCQYGDAYRTLTILENRYRPWLNSMEKFTATSKPADYYATVLKYLRSPSDSNVDGLPHQVIREMARHKDFLNLQEGINNLEDEIARYPQILNDIVHDKEIVVQKLLQGRKQLFKLEAQIRAVHKAGNLVKFDELVAEYRVQEAWVNFYRFKLLVHLQAREAFAKMEKRVIRNDQLDKDHLVAQAQFVLGRRLARMQAQLKRVLDNNELLRYEVFAGAGENISYQVAGGKVGRVPASVKPTSKELTWNFEGEYWADEIGHYRSSLVDNCAGDQNGLAETKSLGGGK